MHTISFATSNKEKLLIARTVCEQYGITVKQEFIDIDEIQGEDPEIIIRDKVMRAYNSFGSPVVVSDDSWDIPALNGFPGAYMKSINTWFTADDFLRLMSDIENRTIILHQYLALTDGNKIEIYKNDLPGKIITEVRGNNIKSPNMSVTILDSDNGKTIAEVFEQGEVAVADRYKNRRDVWNELVEKHSI
ncbi:MAG: non-canonical purine NTP pyrophosphatase [Patescibacteria group bacterium]|nr:non-canonical purine NTP pyrophosphatase [Patescibacteria group bacterium]